MKRYLRLTPCAWCANYIDTENDMFSQGEDGILCCECFDPLLLEMTEEHYVTH